MVVTRRQNIAGNNNIEDLKPKLNGSADGQVQYQVASRTDRRYTKLNVHKISSVAKKSFRLVAYPIECFVCVVAIFYLVLVLFPLLVVYNILKFTERQWSYLKYGSVAMSGQDALWLQDTPENRLIINSHMVLECTNIQHLVDSVKAVVMGCILMKNEKGHPVHARFTQCIYRGMFQYFLRESDNFDMDQHVYAYKGQVPKSHEEMEALISTLGAEDILFDKPAWQIILIPKTYEANEAILMLRVHHGIADGVSLTRFLLEKFPDEKLPENKLLKFSNVNRKWMYLNALLSGARMLVAKVITTPNRSIIHGPPMKGIKKMSWSKPISLQVVKKIKNYTGMTVNDVMMTCVSMSFHDYFKAHGVSNPPDITALVPVDVRPKNQPLKLENNFTVISLQLPVSKKDPLDSLYATKAHMDDVKHSGEAFVLAFGGHLTVEYMPENINSLWNIPIANKHSLVLSNVPGPQKPFTFSGHKVTEIFFAPPQRDLVGIGVGLYSYAGQFSIGVQSDLNVMANPKLVVDAFESKLAQLEKSVVGANGHIQFDNQ